MAVAICAGLALGFAPAFSQAAPSSSSGVARVTLNHFYIINSLGFGVLNDSFTFSNNGTSSAQIPTLQVGLPPRISARISDLVLSPGTQFSLSQSQSSDNTTVTITPDQPTLNAGANVTVALKGVLNHILNYSIGGSFTTNAPSLLLYSPSLNMNVTTLNSYVIVPSGGEFLTIPAGFVSPASAGGSLLMQRTDVRPVASEGYLTFNSTTQTGFTPIRIDSLVRTIVPSANGSPMV